MFKKYLLFLLLSGMTVILVCSSLMFLKKSEEPSVDHFLEMVSETKTLDNLPETEAKPDIDTVIEEKTEEAILRTENSMEQETAVEEKLESVTPWKDEIILPEKKSEEPESQSEKMPVTENLQEVQPEDIRAELPEQESTLTPVTVPEEPSSTLSELARHEHSWIFESCYQEPTCSNGGLENQICAHCGETRIVGGTPTGEHDYVVETEGDCCSEEIVRCSVCNARETRGYNMTNHIDVEDGICYGCGQKVSGE